MQAICHETMLPSRQRTRSAPRNWTRFAAQYSARGLPCERFTAALASRTSCITRGRGGWLDLPRGGLSPPLPACPGALQSQVRHPVIAFMAATLDGVLTGTGAVYEAKFMLPWSFSEEFGREVHGPAPAQYVGDERQDGGAVDHHRGRK